MASSHSRRSWEQDEFRLEVHVWGSLRCSTKTAPATLSAWTDNSSSWAGAVAYSPKLRALSAGRRSHRHGLPLGLAEDEAVHV